MATKLAAGDARSSTLGCLGGATGSHHPGAAHVCVLDVMLPKEGRISEAWSGPGNWSPKHFLPGAEPSSCSPRQWIEHPF